MTSQDVNGSGTLLWVGQPEIAEFKPILEFCFEHAPQVAVRSSLDDACKRPAHQVSGIVLARPDRAPICRSSLTDLISRHGSARAIQLIGPLCCGDRHSNLSWPQIEWHQWKGYFQRLLQPCSGNEPRSSSSSVRSVAVVADIASAAEPLMDIVTACSATALWCRTPSACWARNIDVVWWDDSIAQPANEIQWRQRLKTMERRCHCSPKHVWLTNMPDTQSVRSARSAGVDAVISKPSRIESLMATLDPHEDQVAIDTKTVPWAA